MEKSQLKELLNANGVYKVPSNFKRYSDEHKAWRSLRSRGLVVVEGDEQFEPGAIVNLTELAKLVRDQLTKAVQP